MKIALVKTDKGFIPAWDTDKENADKIAIGEVREYETKENRNLKHHRKFFALLRLALHLVPESKQEEAMKFEFSFKTETDMLYYVKMKLGYYKPIMILKNGSTALIPTSISFDKMGQDEFEEFYSKAVDCIIELVEADRSLLEKELSGFM